LSIAGLSQNFDRGNAPTVFVLMKHLFSLKSLAQLFFPHLCLSCQKALPQRSMFWCLTCQRNLPFTSLHAVKDNFFTQRLMGRVKIEAGMACFYFVKGGKVQPMLHALKYGNQREVGVQLGRAYAKSLIDHPVIRTVDALVPVPLHWKKERIRGYNQAHEIAKGIGEVLEKPVYPKALLRNTNRSSQTSKSRMERLESVLSAFEMRQKDRLVGKHILLVDDVLTSGATLEACALPILALPHTKVSMVTLAIAT